MGGAESSFPLNESLKVFGFNVHETQFQRDSARYLRSPRMNLNSCNDIGLSELAATALDAMLKGSTP